MVDLEELRRLNEARTGQWLAHDYSAPTDQRWPAHGYTAFVADATTRTLIAECVHREHAALIQALPALLEEISAGKEREAKLRAAIAWVGEVTPRPLPLTGVTVEMTLEEFNAMRELIGRTALTRAALGSAP